MPLPKKYTIGIDIGTGSVKAIALDHNGGVIHLEQDFYSTSHPQPGYAEQDPEVILEAFLCVTDRLIRTLKSDPDVISFSSAMHSLVVTDQNGNAVTPLILWSDARSADIASKLRGTAEGKRIYADTGTPVHAMSPLCKIIWMRQHQPQWLQKDHRFLSMKEYCWYRLFSEFVIDHSIASATGLFDIKTRKWNEECLQLAGISAQQLSRPVSTSYLKKNLNRQYANALHLSTDVPFCIGASDGCLANLGSGALVKGHAALTIGTSGAIRIHSTAPVVDVEKMFFNYLLDDTYFICGAPVNNGGNVAEWLLTNFMNAAQEQMHMISDSLSKTSAGAEGLICLPYFNGERAPVWNEHASGVYFGIRSKHHQHHFIRAALEGVCFSFRQLLNDLEKATGPVSVIHASGGFIHSAEWIQLLTDIMGREVIIQRDDASAVGAAMMGMKAIGVLNQYESWPVAGTSTYYPDNRVKPVYDENFGRFRKLYGLLRELM